MLLAAHVVRIASIFLPPPDQNLVNVLEMLCVLAVVGLVFTSVRLMSTRRDLTSTRRANSELSQAQHNLTERDSKFARDREAQALQIQELKQEVGALRKKNHAALEETKKLREDLREQVRLRQEAETSRPAFAEVVTVRPKPAPEKKSIEKAEPIAVAPSLHLEAKMVQLTSENVHLGEQLSQERSSALSHKDELKRLRKRGEELRRIDLLNKSKLELMNDKLRGMGRQYYDAISELAALKGEVVPPRPREADEAPAHEEPDTSQAEHHSMSGAEA